MSAVAPAFRRLFDAHTHWTQASDSYFDPWKFRLEINALIQALRSVTFILQKHKDEIPQFDEWYGVWQERMRANKQLRWLVEARNKIVKQGDLNLFSMLRVSIVGSYLDSEVPYREYMLSPKLDNNSIIKDARNSGVPEEVLKNSFLKIERRWVEKEEPETELLEKLTNCWVAIADLLKNATVQCGEEAENQIDSLEPPVCMKKFSETRSSWIKASTGEPESLAVRSKSVSKEDMKKSAKRYSFSKEAKQFTTLKEECQYFFSIGLKMLEKDGHHVTVCFLVPDSGVPELLQLAPEDQADKYRMMRVMADKVDIIRAKKIIFIGEIWTAEFDPQKPLLHAAEHPDRGEALQLIGMSYAGERVVLFAPFTRNKRRIVLAATEETSYEGTNILAPVEAVWKRWKEGEASNNIK